MSYGTTTTMRVKPIPNLASLEVCGLACGPRDRRKNRSPGWGHFGVGCRRGRAAALLVTDLATGVAGEQGSSNRAERTQQAVCENRTSPGGRQETWVPGSFFCVFVLKKILILLLKYFLASRDCYPDNSHKMHVLTAVPGVGRESGVLFNNTEVNVILTTFKLQLATSVQIALRDEIKLNVRGSVSFQKLIRSRTLTLRKTNASLIFPSKSGQ